MIDKSEFNQFFKKILVKNNKELMTTREIVQDIRNLQFYLLSYPLNKRKEFKVLEITDDIKELKEVL